MNSSSAQPSVLITGSTSGIGAAIARETAQQGWRVIVTGRDAARAAQVIDDIAADGGSATFVASDLAGPPSGIRAFAQEAREAAGGTIDAVVHCAARYARRLIRCR